MKGATNGEKKGAYGGVAVTKHRSLFLKNFKSEMFLHLLVLPAVIYFLIFSYGPMYGIMIAFKDFSFGAGILGSPWVGFKHFEQFFGSMYFGRLIKNTVLISLYNLLWSMPIPIIFALLLSELRNNKIKRFVQTVSYFPHFIASVIVVGMMFTFLSPVDGIINEMLSRLGMERINFMDESKYFRTLYIASGIWQSFGWDSILYISALSAIPTEQYETAKIDGASRFQQTLYVSLPGIMPTFIILFILQVGKIMSVGSSKILLMYSPSTYDVADVISTYVYRKSIVGGEFSFGTAVDVFNMVINFVLVWVTNKISKKLSDISLW